MGAYSSVKWIVLVTVSIRSEERKRRSKSASNSIAGGRFRELHIVRITPGNGRTDRLNRSSSSASTLTPITFISVMRPSMIGRSAAAVSSIVVGSSELYWLAESEFILVFRLGGHLQIYLSPGPLEISLISIRVNPPPPKDRNGTSPHSAPY